MTEHINTLAFEFWKQAIVQNDAEAAENIINGAVVEDVNTDPSGTTPSPSTTGSFQFVDTSAGRGTQGESNLLSPRALVAGSPTGTISAWNSKTLVSLVVVSNETVCGMKLFPKTEKDEDCMICGAFPCPTDTHEKRKKQHGPDMDLPSDGSRVYAIKVRSSSQSKPDKLRFFSRPCLKESDLPIESRTPEISQMLCAFSFTAKTFKALIEGYPGYDVMTELLRLKAGGAPRVAPLDIPSPQAGAAYGNDFAERPSGAARAADQLADTIPSSSALHPVSSVPSISSHGSDGSEPSASGESNCDSLYEDTPSETARGTSLGANLAAKRNFALPAVNVELGFDVGSVGTNDPTVAKLQATVETLNGTLQKLVPQVNNSATYNAEALKRIEVTINELLGEVDTLTLDTKLSLTEIGDTARKAKSTADRAIKLTKKPASGGGPDMTEIAAHLLADDDFKAEITAHLLADDDFKAKLCSTLATGSVFTFENSEGVGRG